MDQHDTPHHLNVTGALYLVFSLLNNTNICNVVRQPCVLRCKSSSVLNVSKIVSLCFVKVWLVMLMQPGLQLFFIDIS